ncbi:hypothetical protein J437_LFUL006631 [Ladona fulva]|uniref:Enhancer of mRNA-decapping protein 4 C-terminal domain-containing protein n=1 Tax=Ladona fulva TaxID=123851 RepID=A0A8K0P7C6_LADFU|nr:hypothetical protein J437_LFUL006631 [Ladona fulva]
MKMVYQHLLWTTKVTWQHKERAVVEPLAVEAAAQVEKSNRSSLSQIPLEVDKEEGQGAVERPVDEEDAILPFVRQEGDGAGIGADGRRGSGLSSLILEVGSLARAVRAQNESFQRFRSEIKSEISLLRNECCWGGEGITRVASVIESSLRPQLENSVERCVSQAMERMGPLIEVTLEEHRRELCLQQEKFLREGPSVCWDAVVRSAVSSGLEPLRQQLGSEAATQAETAAREGVSLALQKNSKMLVDNIANGLLVTLRPAMLEVFRQAFAALVLPSFEKSCSHMFQQINDAFSHGTKECKTDQLDKVVVVVSQGDRERRAQKLDTSKGSLPELHSVEVESNDNNADGRAMEAHLERKWNTEKSKEAAALESVRNEARQLAEAIQKDVPEQIQKLSSSLRESLAQEVRSALEEPLTRGLKEQRELLEGNFSKSLQTIMFSPARVAPVGTEGGKRGPTPTSSPSGVSPNGAILMRSRFSELVTQGRLNEAFQMALSASDLGLVTYLCELTTPAQVFGGKCKLEQPVLLSLVQQLSANLFDRTELKMGYLIEAVLYLDVHQPELKEHLTMVLGVLQKGINSYLASRPGSCLAKEMTMLLRMASSLMEFAKCKSISYNYRTDSANVPLME